MSHLVPDNWKAHACRADRWQFSKTHTCIGLFKLFKKHGSVPLERRDSTEEFGDTGIISSAVVDSLSQRRGKKAAAFPLPLGSPCTIPHTDYSNELQGDLPLKYHVSVNTLWNPFHILFACWFLWLTAHWGGWQLLARPSQQPGNMSAEGKQKQIQEAKNTTTSIQEMQ